MTIIPLNTLPHEQLSTAVEQRVAGARQTQSERLRNANLSWAARHPGCSVRAVHILTESVWNGRHGTLLLNVLELTPYDAWNIVHLPGDLESSQMMDLPVAPRDEIPDAVRAAERQIARLARDHGVIVKGFMGRVTYGGDDARQAMQDSLAHMARSIYDDIIVPKLSAQQAVRYHALSA